MPKQADTVPCRASCPQRQGSGLLRGCLVLSCFFRVHPLGGLFLAHAEAGLHCTVQSITPPWAGCSGLVLLNQSRGVVRLLHMYCPSSTAGKFTCCNPPTPERDSQAKGDKKENRPRATFGQWHWHILGLVLALVMGKWRGCVALGCCLFERQLTMGLGMWERADKTKENHCMFGVRIPRRAFKSCGAGISFDKVSAVRQLLVRIIRTSFIYTCCICRRKRRVTYDIK